MTAMRQKRVGIVPLVAVSMVVTGAVLLATSSPARAAAAGGNTVHVHALTLPRVPGGAIKNGSGPSGASLGAAQAPAVHGSSPPCTGQHGLNNPTSSNSQALDSYQYTIQRGSTTTTVCSLFGNVRAGDVVTASFTVHDSASVEVTLVVNTFTAGGSKSQVLAQCASFSSVPDSGADSCSTSGAPSLTVTVPQCGFQIDLIYGEAMPSLTTGAYADAHVWIDGTQGEKTTACPAGPTPTATPGTPGSPGGSGTGVEAASTSTPETGWSPTSAQGLAGIALLVSGSAMFATARLRSTTVTRIRRRRASRYPRIFRR